jgi:hypothetical protein
MQISMVYYLNNCCKKISKLMGKTSRFVSPLFSNPPVLGVPKYCE